MSTAAVSNLLIRAKVMLRIITNAFDGEITGLIQAAVSLITTRGVTIAENDDHTVDPLVERAILTYVRVNFGEPSDYDRLKASFDEQLGQLMTTTGYTTWG